MRRRNTLIDAMLALTVLVHLAVSLIHGRAHTGAAVGLAPSAMLFVIAVVLATPLLGLAMRLRLRWRRSGAWLIAASLAGSLVFGLVNHFAINGPDRVDHVAGPWQLVFGASALGLAVLEGFGSGLAAWCALRTGRQS